MGLSAVFAIAVSVQRMPISPSTSCILLASSVIAQLFADENAQDVILPDVLDLSELLTMCACIACEFALLDNVCACALHAQHMKLCHRCACNCVHMQMCFLLQCHACARALRTIDSLCSETAIKDFQVSHPRTGQ